MGNTAPPLEPPYKGLFLPPHAASKTPAASSTILLACEPRATQPSMLLCTPQSTATVDCFAIADFALPSDKLIPETPLVPILFPLAYCWRFLSIHFIPYLTLIMT